MECVSITDDHVVVDAVKKHSGGGIKTLLQTCSVRKGYVTFL